MKRFNFLKGEGETISRAEYMHKELDAWLVELALRRIDGEAGLVKSGERLIECGIVFVLVSAIKHDVVTNISYAENIGYQRVDGVLENLCGGVDSKTDPLYGGKMPPTWRM